MPKLHSLAVNLLGINWIAAYVYRPEQPVSLAAVGETPPLVPTFGNDTVSRCVSTMPWATAGFNKLYQTQFGIEGAGNVFYPTSEDELLGAMQYAVNSGRSFSVMSGGHGYEGYATSGDVVISMAALQEIAEESAEESHNGKPYVTVQGGTPLLKVYSYTYNRLGTIIPGGSCYSVCAGGHITGGGYGLYSRMFGLTVDYVYGVKFAWVNSKGEVKVTKAFVDSPETELQELVWASRGASAGNFGVILHYYLDKQKMEMNKPPSELYQVVLTIVPFAKIPSGDAGYELYDALWMVYWNYFKSPQSDPTTFGFLRANAAGITLFCSSGSYQGLYKYVSLFVDVLDTVDTTLKNFIMIHPGKGAGYGDNAGMGTPIAGDMEEVSPTGHTARTKSVTNETGFTIAKIADMFDSYKFFDYVQINDGIDPNSYFKNSGHVLKEGSAGGRGYTRAQTRVIYEHTLQAYRLATADEIKSGNENLVVLDVRDDMEGVTPNTTYVGGEVKIASKKLYLIKTNQDDTDPPARPQWGWISQHRAPTASQQKAQGGSPSDYGVHYTYQHDPYNGNVGAYTADNPVPMPKMPLPTSVSNRMNLVKVQPQLYWNFKEDSPFMLKWFDSFTNSMFASNHTNNLNTTEYPPVDGLYINYPDTYYKQMYPMTADPETQLLHDDTKDVDWPTWPHLVYGNGNDIGGEFLPMLQKVKGQFDPLQYFNLKSKKSYESKAFPAIGIPPPPKGTITPYDKGDAISEKAHKIASSAHDASNVCVWDHLAQKQDQK